MCEDDIILNANPAFAVSAIEEATRIGADLVLLNIQNYPGSAQMGRETQSNGHRFHRLYGGVGSGLAYIVRHEFGQTLIKLWKKSTSHKKHIDITWQALWPSHKVYVHRPLIMLSATGQSKTGDTRHRTSDATIRDFNWDRMTVSRQEFQEDTSASRNTTTNDAVVYSLVACITLMVLFIAYYRMTRPAHTKKDEPDFDMFNEDGADVG